MIDWRTLIAGSLLGSTLIAGVATAQTLRVGLAEDPDVLDPTLSRTFVSEVVRTALCDRLFDIGLELEIAPQLATAWEWTDDRKGLVVKLRPGVKFHDGELFDAAAVKFNIERHLTMPGSTRKSDIKAITSIEIIDEYTVKFVLSAPFAPLLAQLAGPAGTMVSPKAARATGENFGSHPVCTGPFKFVEHVAQDRIVVERFADYWDKDNIKLDRIVYLPIPDTTVRLANLRSGGLDLTQIAATDLDTVRKDSRLKLTAVNGIGYSGITLNVANGEGSKTPLGRDARVRQALELSIDREALNQVVFNGENQPGNQWVSPTNPYYVRELPIQARDVAKAKALLAAAAAPNPVIAMTATNNPVVSVGPAALTPTATSTILLHVIRRSMTGIIATPRSTASSMQRARLTPERTALLITGLSPSASCGTSQSFICITPSGCTPRPPDCRGSSLTPTA